MGIVLVSLEQITIEKLLRLGLSATNNEAEYKALLEGMSMVQRMGAKVVKMFSDSRLVVGQVKGKLEARDERMKGCLSQVRHLQSRFVSRPKPGTWICDHDRHANIKPKPDINKNQLNFLKTFTKSFLFLFIFVSLLKRYNLLLDSQSIYIVLQRIT